MDEHTLKAALKSHLVERQRLDQAASIAKATEACAEAGNVDKVRRDRARCRAEVTTMLNAASLMYRIHNT